jgi:hypothetical protein
MTHRRSSHSLAAAAFFAVLWPAGELFAQAQESQQAHAPKPSEVSRFETRILAGGAVNELRLFDVAPTSIAGLPKVSISWPCLPNTKAEESEAYAKNAVFDSTANAFVPTQTMLLARIPRPPCARDDGSVYHYARIKVQAGERILFDGTAPVSDATFPLWATFFILALIYPGCAVATWLVQWRKNKFSKPAGILRALDPVQITADAYGRASLAKLQIFGFSFIVFGLLIYYQFRNGILTGLSQDVLLLLGISAVGTVGGRITYAAKRRFSLDNWAWLRLRQWFQVRGEGINRRALWSELVVDPDKGEFDPYSFQMGIFSVVVAVALISSSLTGLTTFEIPDELLGLLGLSQAVFIAGKAAEKSPYVELDARITSIRAHQRSYQEALALAAASADPKIQSESRAKADAERAAFKSEVSQAADMFEVLYGAIPASAPRPHDIEPEAHQPLPAQPPPAPPLPEQALPEQALPGQALRGEPLPGGANA